MHGRHRQKDREPQVSEVAITLQLLQGAAGELADLQRVMEGAPRYSHIATGAPPGPDRAHTLYTMLPEGKDRSDKFVFGIYHEGSMVGCVDVIRGYPDAATAFIGLLLISETAQGRGVGRASYRATEEIVRGWDGCRQVRLGVLRNNHDALAFWRKLGFAQSGEVRPYQHGPVTTDILIMTKSLD